MCCYSSAVMHTVDEVRLKSFSSARWMCLVALIILKVIHPIVV